MKKAWKRILAFVLTVCMTAAMVPAVIAAESSADTAAGIYNFAEHGASAGNDLSGKTFADTDGKWAFYSAWANKVCLAIGANGADSSGVQMNFSSNATKQATSWVALKIKAPAAGIYTVSVDLAKTGGCQTAVHILPVGTEITTSNSASLLTDANKIGSYNGTDLKQKVGTWDWEGTATEVLLVFRHDQSNTVGNYSYLNAMTLIKHVASVGTETFATVAEAVTAAANGAENTVKLIENVTEDIVLTTGVILDLNGKTLAAGNVQSVNDSHVVDGSIGNMGVLMLTAGGTLDLSESNQEIPLYDTEKGGYRFFAGELKNLKAAASEDKKSSKFWFTLKFDSDNADAYDLIATGESGLILSVDMKWGGGRQTATFGEGHATVNGWAGIAAEYAEKDPKATAAIWLVVNGVDEVSELSLTPTVMAANSEVKLTGTALSNPA